MSEQWSAGAHCLYFMPWYDYDNDLSEAYNHKFADIAWWKASWECKDVIGLDDLPDDLYK